MTVKELIERVRKGEDPADIVNEMAVTTATPEGWTPDNTEPRVGKYIGKDVLAALAPEPLKTSELSNKLGVGPGPLGRIVIRLKDTGYIASTPKGYALTTPGITYIKAKAVEVGRETLNNAKQADVAASSHVRYKPGIGVPLGAPTSGVVPAPGTSAMDAIGKAKRALGHMASTSEIGQRVTKDPDSAGFHYSEKDDQSNWTVTVDIEKAGIKAKEMSIMLPTGKRAVTYDLSSSDKKKLSSEVEKLMKAAGINAQDAQVIGVMGKDAVVKFVAAAGKAKYGVRVRPGYFVTYDPATGEPVKHALYGKGQMTLWPESLKQKITKLQEAVEK